MKTYFLLLSIFISDCVVLAFTNTVITYTNGQHHGSTASITCSDGYTLQSGTDQECVDGTWNGVDPVCKKGNKQTNEQSINQSIKQT